MHRWPHFLARLAFLLAGVTLAMLLIPAAQAWYVSGAEYQAIDQADGGPDLRWLPENEIDWASTPSCWLYNTWSNPHMQIASDFSFPYFGADLAGSFIPVEEDGEVRMAGPGGGATTRFHSIQMFETPKSQCNSYYSFMPKPEKVRYGIWGEAPDRIHVLEIQNLPSHVASSSSQHTTAQLHLFEETGIIEMHFDHARRAGSYSHKTGIKGEFNYPAPGGVLDDAVIHFRPLDVVPTAQHDGDLDLDGVIEDARFIKNMFTEPGADPRVLEVAAPILMSNDAPVRGVDGRMAFWLEVETLPSKGTLVFNPDGSFTYTLNEDACGFDSFTYHSRDVISKSEPATVTIEFRQCNLPVAEPDFYYVEHNQLTDLMVLANDFDVDVGETLFLGGASSLKAAQVSIVDPSAAASDEYLQYQPPAGFKGDDEIRYILQDSAGREAEGIAYVRVGGPPEAKSFVYALEQWQDLEIAAPGLLAGARDMEGDPLTLVLDHMDDGLIIGSDGSIAFYPEDGFRGTLRATYHVEDPHGTASAPATLVLHVYPPLPTGNERPYREVTGAQWVAESNALGTLDSSPVELRALAPIADLVAPDDAAPGVLLLDASGSKSPSGTLLSAEWEIVSGGPASWIDREGLQAALAVGDVPMPGAYLTVQVRVSDGVGWDVAQETIWIQGTNAPPSVVVQGPEEVLPGDVVVLSANFSSDVDDDMLAYHWEQVRGPAVERWEAVGPRLSFVAPEGVLGFRLTVDDGWSPSVVRHVVVAEAPLVVEREPVLELALSGSGPFVFRADWDGFDGKPTVTWRMPDGSTLEGPEVAWSPPMAGAFEIVATASDGEREASAEFAVVAGPVEAVPVGARAGPWGWLAPLLGVAIAGTGWYVRRRR